MVDNKSKTSLTRHNRKNISLMKINNILLVLHRRNNIVIFIGNIVFHSIWWCFPIIFNRVHHLREFYMTRVDCILFPWILYYWAVGLRTFHSESVQLLRFGPMNPKGWLKAYLQLQAGRHVVVHRLLKVVVGLGSLPTNIAVNIRIFWKWINFVHSWSQGTRSILLPAISQ